MAYIKKSEILLFQGDSITDVGRRDSPDGLGSGYVSILKGYLAARHPGLGLKIINRGVGGDRSVELLKRWKEDCEVLRPDVLTIMVGVNDVWRILGPWEGQTYVEPSQFRDNYRQLIQRALASGLKRLILMSPTTIENEKDPKLSALLDERAQITKDLAKEFKARYVPTREEQKRLLRHHAEVQWTTDGCHPSVAGHAAIAASWLKAVGL